MDLCRPCGACNEPDAKNPIQGGLRHHDIVPGRYAAIEQAVQVVERFESQRLVISFRSWDQSENCESERWLGNKREIIRFLDEGNK
jgi:hypothetical protein